MVTTTVFLVSITFSYHMRRFQAHKKTFQKILGSPIHIFICFQSMGIKYLHYININSVRVGRENLVERKCCGKNLQRSLTKLHLSVIALDVRIQKLLGLLLELKHKHIHRDLEASISFWAPKLSAQKRKNFLVQYSLSSVRRDK